MIGRLGSVLAVVMLTMGAFWPLPASAVAVRCHSQNGGGCTDDTTGPGWKEISDLYVYDLDAGT